MSWRERWHGCHIFTSTQLIVAGHLNHYSLKRLPYSKTVILQIQGIIGGNAQVKDLVGRISEELMKRT
jgi:hypothetical protein